MRLCLQESQLHGVIQAIFTQCDLTLFDDMFDFVFQKLAIDVATFVQKEDNQESKITGDMTSGQPDLPSEYIMHCPFTYTVFCDFMKHMSCDFLLHFWKDVERFKYGPAEDPLCDISRLVTKFFDNPLRNVDPNKTMVNVLENGQSTNAYSFINIYNEV